MSKRRIKIPQNLDLLAKANLGYEVRLGKERFFVRPRGPEMLFSSTNGQIVGRIYRSPSGTGALYLGQECIAEFSRVAGTDDYVIRPVINGQFDPQKEQKGYPVRYFLTRLHERRNEHSVCGGAARAELVPA
jgi:hypothetical protein